ncbi:hypothetical protein P154DRAFT_575964 [Amniculicola lignicola CBS 123094]|uniref:Uncharacterized protein n=1 Tax=Amniculicola lignicola CBS 123094 TaxID=1392246 RepID=A0A6A5WSR9_9PLEO|nr:hypothetical protein P154DRAFT_575964 [Amniculicola lignicola CBS 123094]
MNEILCWVVLSIMVVVEVIAFDHHSTRFTTSASPSFHDTGPNERIPQHYRQLVSIDSVTTPGQTSIQTWPTSFTHISDPTPTFESAPPDLWDSPSRPLTHAQTIFLIIGILVAVALSVFLLFLAIRKRRKQEARKHQHMHELELVRRRTSVSPTHYRPAVPIQFEKELPPLKIDRQTSDMRNSGVASTPTEIDIDLTKRQGRIF